MISVVIPLYNKSNCISRAINSVLAQTYEDYEVIVVDDGSTDNGVEVVSAIKDDRIRIIKKSNGGVSSARNVGIRLSRANYVAFLDADDFWAEGYLAEVVSLIDEFPDAGIFGIGLGQSHNGIVSLRESSVISQHRGYVEQPWCLISSCWSGSSSTIIKSAFEKVGYFDERMAYGEDLDMWWRVLLEYPGVYSSRILAFYEQDSENRAMTKTIPFEKHFPYFIEKYRNYRANNEAFRFFYDRECLYRLFQYTCNKRYEKDLKRVLRQIDFSLQKPSMKLRFIFPRAYRLYLKAKQEA